MLFHQLLLLLVAPALAVVDVPSAAQLGLMRKESAPDSNSSKALLQLQYKDRAQPPDKPLDFDYAVEAFKCCGLQRAYDYVMSLPAESRRDAYEQLLRSSEEDREELLSPFKKYPGGYCESDYDCNFETEKAGALINCFIEHYTIDAYNKWIPTGARVLEVGARYGQASCYLSKIVGSEGRVVSVDADADVWSVWQKNIDKHSCNARLVQGVVGREDKSLVAGLGYGTKTGDAAAIAGGIKVKAHSVESLEVEFDTLAIDCEGCFAGFFAENPGLEDKLKLIVVEMHDDGEKAEVERLKQIGWRSMDDFMNITAMTILSKSPIRESNHPCLSKIGG